MTDGSAGWGGVFLRVHLPVIMLGVVCLLGYVDLSRRIEQAPIGRAEAPVQETRPVEAPGSEATDAWICRGTIAQEDVLRVVGEQGQAVFDCYSKLLAVRPGYRASVVVEVKVDAHGMVEDARVTGPDPDPQWLDCVTDPVLSWRFPPPAGGACAVVSIPFALSPEDHAPEPQENAIVP
jgi:hypothetical protein